MARTSATQSTTRRPGCRSERPYPGRSYVMTCAPVVRTPSSSGMRLSRQPGVPCSEKTGSPSGSPQVLYASVRPSTVVVRVVAMRGP